MVSGLLSGGGGGAGGPEAGARGARRGGRVRCAVLAGGTLACACLLLSVMDDVLFLTGDALAPAWDAPGPPPPPDDERYTIRTEGCTIPMLRPLDPAVQQFVQPQSRPAPCPRGNYSLVSHNRTHIWVNRVRLRRRGGDPAGVSCCYRGFYRPAAVADVAGAGVDDRAVYRDCVHFADVVEATDEFARVQCYLDGELFYDQFFLFAVEKEFEPDRDDPEIDVNKTTYNVLVLGIDSISRMNFYRSMPKTLKYLNRKSAIELRGYNKVGDNTFPNLVPMLLGIKDTELQDTCLPSMWRTFDNCPFVWERFRRAGFVTALGEDTAALGTFNYQRTGFARTPTDYYLHTFMREANDRVGCNKDFNSNLCMGGRYFYQVLLDYVRGLALAAAAPLFGFFWEVTMSHDYLNYPAGMDDSYDAFLGALDAAGYLDDTVLVLLSDHGIRWGDIRYTKQGRLEENLPFIFILLPPSFKENYKAAYDNIKVNQFRLTTPYDLHATLADLADLDALNDTAVARRSGEPYAAGRSISLFLPVPRNRTCAAAGIEDHWCTCHADALLDPRGALAAAAASHLVRHLNDMLRGHPQCAPLRLERVVSAFEMEQRGGGGGGGGGGEWREVRVVAAVAPSGAMFEATLRNSSAWSVAGTVSRLNLYGEQSRCVHDYRLKLYCYCD